MPELPEVETMCRGIRDSVGGVIVAIAEEPCERLPISISPKIKTIQRRASGATMEAIDRIGKRVVMRLSTGDCLVIEPRMTGLVLVADPPSIEHLRLRITLTGCKQKRIWFWDRRGLGTVRLLKPSEQAAALGPPKLGPDALEVTDTVLRAHLGSSRRAIKVALLDQSKIAGIGNLYASEILHVAQVDPRQLCSRLRPIQWRAIADATLAVLQEAIHHEGSTLSDGTYRNALNQAGDYQNMHRVYDRADRPCPRCGGLIERIVQAQRSTFFCKQCQRKAPPSKRTPNGSSRARKSS